MKIGLHNRIYKRADAHFGRPMQHVGHHQTILQQPQRIQTDEPTATLDPLTPDIFIHQQYSYENSFTDIVNTKNLLNV